ncbi:MAG: PHP domain-containing protein [Candidatus Helarchaeales archaeon]
MIDLHVHTFFSDGSCSIPEACSIALQKKLKALAISDHFTTTWKSSVINCLSLSNIQDYIQTIESQKSRFSKVLRILTAIEIDCESDWKQIMRLPLEKFDLINFEYVSDQKLLQKVVGLRKMQGLEDVLFCLAHSSIFNYSKKSEIPKICSILNKHSIAVELNTRYSHYFLQAEQVFRLLIEQGVQFSIGSDAHEPSSIGNISQQYEFLKKLGGLDLIIQLSP